uniref:uncharacterized protein LOC122597905 n=1 Tax=Erigeron canadensis TaxID=72917 RepID=UPI001CB980FC|nr:uncharacterized protein LOC122597905 [Erigeron canadensis]
MKLYLIFTLLVLSSLLTNYRAQAILNRKLMTKDASSSTTSAATILKDQKNDEKLDHNTEVKSASNGLVGKKDGSSTPNYSSHGDSKHGKKEVVIIPEQYPDVIEDIAGMDYSPARKKAPIHN